MMICLAANTWGRDCCIVYFYDSCIVYCVFVMCVWPFVSRTSLVRKGSFRLHTRLLTRLVVFRIVLVLTWTLESVGGEVIVVHHDELGDQREG
jgi:predicted small integral membrane protein